MQNRNSKKVARLLALLLIASMASGTFVSCTKEEDPKKPDDTTAPTVTDTTAPEETGPTLNIAKTDFGGASLRILGMDSSYGVGYYETNDIWAGEESSDALTSAVYDRTMAMEDKYGIAVAYTPGSGVASTIRSCVEASLDEYDLYFENWHTQYSLSKNAVSCDFREIDTIDLTNPWWDQNANKDLAVANRLFYTTGEMTTLDDKCTRYLYFNKDLVETYNLDNPYTLVNENAWTLDVFEKMCLGVKDDLDGGGIDAKTDRYGFFYEQGQVSYFMQAGGFKFATVNEDGTIQENFIGNEDAFNKMVTVATMLTNKDICQSIDDIGTLPGYNNRWASGRGLFANGQHLFTLGGALVIAEFSEMEDEFGILPLPKYDANQTRYYHTPEPSAPMCAIPSTKLDTGDLGMMLEAFSYEGMNILTPVFREKLLERRYTRDAESLDMLALIFESKSFDLGFCSDYGGVLGTINGKVNYGSIPTASQFKRIESKAIKAMEKDYNDILNAGKKTAEE